ncbi:MULTISPECIES: hypothetical protein [unclassified Microbacterium]|uniref:hypothetical protein n=1 Tax=unclassified Microbacterium TaxID=2609290 RepID=UPI000EAAC3F6|nr:MULTISPECIES: hypothetical protein [unclassified Microbacterium]MBT2485733.1 hypothetical protein [Microbacterium sp. ISL-108]RKN68501.1 hypothetical protein D7252_13520 [Microbacterium sp. CGR2]
MTRSFTPLRPYPRASNSAVEDLDRKRADAARFVNAVSARLGVAASAGADQLLAAFDAAPKAPASLASRAGWATPAAAGVPRPAAPAPAAVNALAAKAGWAVPGRA